MVHAQLCGDFSQPCAGGCEKSAERSSGLGFLETGSPAIGVTAHSFQDSYQLSRDCGFAFAVKAALAILDY
jgi:hypothetical protein